MWPIYNSETRTTSFRLKNWDFFTNLFQTLHHFRGKNLKFSNKQFQSESRQASDLISKQMQNLTRNMKFRFVLYENSKCELYKISNNQVGNGEHQKAVIQAKKQLTCKVKVWYFYFFYFYKLNFINVDTRNFLEKVSTLSLKLAFSGRVLCTLYRYTVGQTTIKDIRICLLLFWSKSNFSIIHITKGLYTV